MAIVVVSLTELSNSSRVTGVRKQQHWQQQQQGQSQRQGAAVVKEQRLHGTLVVEITVATSRQEAGWISSGGGSPVHGVAVAVKQRGR